MATSFRLELDARIPTRPCRCAAEEQALIHRASGIEANDAWLDPFLALMEGIYAIGEAVTDDYPTCGAVITSQIVCIKRPHPIGAPAFVQGRVTAFEANLRGHIFATAITAANASGEPFAEMLTTILLIDPAMQPEKSERAPRSADSPAPSALEIIGRFTFTPEAARGFELDRPPSPHTDAELARAAGFPKPIVSGNQVFSIIWNRLVAPRYELPVELRFTLKRPIFWDEAITFERRDGDASGRDILEVRNAGGKTSIVCEISGGGSLA